MKKPFVLRLDPKAFSRLKSEAKRNDQSINAFCVELIERGLSPNPGALNPVAKEISNHYKDKLLGLVLFGSVARGTQRPSSDVDLLLILSDSVPIQGKLYREWDLFTEQLKFEKYSPHFVHLPKDTQNVGSLWLEVALEGRVWIDKESKVEKQLSEIRQLIAEGVFERSYVYGVPYWKKVA